MSETNDRIHELYMEILDVSTNLAALSSRFDTVEQSNIEVNENLNNIANITDDLSADVDDINIDLQQLNILHETDQELAAEMHAMDIEHHEELHMLALAIDNLSRHVVMSQSQFESIVPDPHTFYYTWED